ncbi:MAG: MFS transporter, partial [Anaerolineales bacterium]|nr:MFS transporter [Anaerolineales bacterium]
FAGIAGLIVPPGLRGPALAWIAGGALAALGLIGAFGVSVVFFALLPAALFGLAAVLAARRLGRGWRDGLSMLVLSAGLNALLVALLISLPKGT